MRRRYTILGTGAAEGVTAPIPFATATFLAKRRVRAVLVPYLLGLALICIYVPWEAQSRGSRSAWDYGFIWSPPAESLTVDRFRLLLTALALTGIALASLLVVPTTPRGQTGAAETAPVAGELERESQRAARSDPDTGTAQRPVEQASAPRSVAEFRAAGYEMVPDERGRTLMDNAAAQRLASDLRQQHRDVHIHRVNWFMRAVLAKPAERPAPPVAAAPPPREYPGTADVRDLPRPAHEALLLLAEPGGRLRAEFMDWDGDLSLEPGSLVPAWYPWKIDGGHLSAAERNAQFGFDIDLLLASHPQTTPAPGPRAMQRESAHTAHDVLRALLELRAAASNE